MSELKEITICGKSIKLGDFVKVRYTTGKNFKDGTVEGKTTKLWSPDNGDSHLQARVENGWCFHDDDEILEHKPQMDNAQPERTAGPWGLYMGTDVKEVIAICTADSKRYDICHFNHIRHPKNPAARTEIKNANAEFIILAVNSHDALVADKERLVDLIHRLDDYITHKGNCTYLMTLGKCSCGFVEISNEALTVGEGGE